MGQLLRRWIEESCGPRFYACIAVLGGVRQWSFDMVWQDTARHQLRELC